MAAIITTDQDPGLAPGNADAGSLRTLSITTTVNHSSSSLSAAASPASAASPSNVSTPTSSSSTAPPIAIRPSASNTLPSTASSMAMNGRSKSIVTSSASMSQPKAMCMTSKEWVIPPRPKPGRKPATDTPPTKRKAQNRAAQRAFRERRAARVGELEEQMEEEKLIHEQTVRELQDRVIHLETETQTLQSRCQWLESMLEKSRQGRGSMAGNWDDQSGAASNDISASGQMQTQAGLSHGMRPLQPAPLRNTAARLAPVVEPRPLAQPFSISQIVSPPDEGVPAGITCGGCQSNGSCACDEDVLRTADVPMGCGRCSLGTRCECLEESLGISMAGNDLKRPLPPSSPPSTSPEDKRQRSDAGVVMETDFTAVFASQNRTEPAQPMFPPPTQSQLQPMASIEPRDSCGFCKDGTYCVCADSMMSPASLPAPDGEVAEHTQTHTPPPSDNDVVPMPMEVTATGAIKLPGLRPLQGRQTVKPTARPGGCGPNGPGTCAQCVADPKSGLFCRSLAANFEKNNPGGGGGSGGGCCGNGGPGGCCKSGPSQPPPQPEALAPLPAMAIYRRPTTTTTTTATPAGPSNLGLSLSCADAYKTLASHRHFDEAADDIGSWLPKLKALPVPRPGPVGGRRGRDGRAPIEVEAASIMSVLKDFDVRFGRGE